MTVVAGESVDVQLSVNTELFASTTVNEEMVGATVYKSRVCSNPDTISY